MDGGTIILASFPGLSGEGERPGNEATTIYNNGKTHSHALIIVYVRIFLLCSRLLYVQVLLP